MGRHWIVWTVMVVCVGQARGGTQDSSRLGTATADRGYVAEWQWEQWPQQLMTDTKNATRGPGPRMASSLWFDSSASSWWLFGGRQVPIGNSKTGTKQKIYTDLWRYDTNSRSWNRIFPNDKLKSTDGGMMLLRTNLYNDGHTRKSTSSSNRNPGVVLCGRSEGKSLDERSLAVYGPRSSHSDTVWQLELKDKQWTAYVCCCDSTERSQGQNTKNDSALPTGTIKHESNITRNYSIVHGNIHVIDNICNDTKLNRKLKDETNNSSNIDNTKNNTEKSKDNKETSSSLEESMKLNVSKADILPINKKVTENVDNTLKETNESNMTRSPSAENVVKDIQNLFGGPNNVSVSNGDDSQPLIRYGDHEDSDFDRHCLPDLEHGDTDTIENSTSSKSQDDSKDNHSEEGSENHSMRQRDVKPKKDIRKQKLKEFNIKTNDTNSNQVFCPDFEASSADRSKGQPVAWCNTDKELLVALDLKALSLTLWQFDLRTSHWAQQKVEIEEGTLWPGCSPNIRYASTGSMVYILCPPYGVTNATSTRLVYRIDATNAALQAAGQLQLNVVFGNRDGNIMWADETKTVLQIVEMDNNRTLLLIAYDKLLDIWVLDRNSDHGYFVPIENIWRGSALKWFRGFDAPFYNLQMAGQTWLLPNPRPVAQYWPRERGRFIIRLTDHGENSSVASPIKEELHTSEIKNHSEVSVPVLQHHQAQDGIKALVFFAFSLSIFAIFGMVVFIRRCVTCPPQSWPLRGDESNKNTPPVIRYSVIPDDLAYPVA